MAARLSGKQIPDAPGLAETAEALRDRASSLCQADAEAYSLVMTAMRRHDESSPEHRSRQIADALSCRDGHPFGGRRDCRRRCRPGCPARRRRKPESTRRRDNRCPPSRVRRASGLCARSHKSRRSETGRSALARRGSCRGGSSKHGQSVARACLAGLRSSSFRLRPCRDAGFGRPGGRRAPGASSARQPDGGPGRRGSRPCGGARPRACAGRSTRRTLRNDAR